MYDLYGRLTFFDQCVLCVVQSMSPIDLDTIRVESWTQTKESGSQTPGRVVTQVLAEGDYIDQGHYVFVRGVLKRNIGLVKAKYNLIDVAVDNETGRVIEGDGIWRKFLERE